MPANASDTARALERFQLIANGPALFNAVVTGLELDIFGYLARHPHAAFEDLEKSTGVTGHKLRVLLLALCSTELVERANSTYANSPLANELLASDRADSWRHILIGWQRIYYPAFPHTTDALRSGTNTALSTYPGSESTLYQRLSQQPDLEAILHSSMSAFTLQSLPALLDNPEVATVRHLIDVGGGAGVTAVEIATRYPQTAVTIFDMPSVTRLAQDGIPAHLSDRVRLKAGDIFSDELPGDADAVLFSHFLEVFSPEEILTILRKAYDALPPGGKMLLYGFNATEEEQGGVLAARLSLYLNVLATGQGMAYPAADYEKWLREVGCGEVRSYVGLPYEHGLTVGTK
ncbi:methyltransferase [Streptomyces sp. ALI-76-A]|uniref:methyltransferase n=1 Tax=Streptomyces sp. ALI-76-A TaxID=3025736 RepID=UPI00256EB353|nr:methyltransferase [Streptomyces sp. ALI-76-A]MDL5199799.1 methyltransferase [Streptomyces sp. ALI-76-A]